jgi:hypothetical protein
VTNILWAFILTILVFFQVKHVNAQSLYLNSRLDFDGNSAFALNVLEFSSDSILICGNAFNVDWSGIGFMGINSSGTKLWQKKHNAQHKIYYPGLVGSMKAFNGQYVLCGSIRDATNHGDVGFFRFSNQGDSLQFMSYGDSAYQEGASLEIAADSGFFLIGTTKSVSVDPDGDFWLIKLNSPT